MKTTEVVVFDMQWVNAMVKDIVYRIRNLRIYKIYVPLTHETLSLLLHNVSKDATSINSFTNKNLAKKKTKDALVTSLLHHHLPKSNQSAPLLYLLNS